jgi:hypothetical protein
VRKIANRFTGVRPVAFLQFILMLMVRRIGKAKKCHLQTASHAQTKCGVERSLMHRASLSSSTTTQLPLSRFDQCWRNRVDHHLAEFFIA